MEEQFPKDLYHSYVIESDMESIPASLLDFLEKRGEIEKQSPDLLMETFESLSISDTGKIKEWHSNKGISDKKKVCIIKTKYINREAEQALLKIIEEPQVNTHFFIIVPDAKMLLDTLLSRVQVVKFENNRKEILTASSFVSMTKKDRINQVAVLIKENKDEENSGNLRYFATSLINEIERILYDKFKKDIKNEEIKLSLKELEKSREYLKTPGASVKMILEHLALVI